MSAPDHWATLVVLGRAAKWTRRKLVGVAITSSTGHVSFSVFLGLALAEVTNLLSKFISHYFTEAVGVIMLVSGSYVALRAFRKKEGQADRKRLRYAKSASLARTTGYFAILGAALSPDLSILPVFLLAIPLGLGTMLNTIMAFAISSILTAVLLVITFSALFTRVVERIPSKYNDILVGLVIAGVGAYVLIFS